MTQKRLRSILGFTLIEILIVLSIIVALMAILMPAFISVRASAQAKVCISNLRQLHIAFQLYAQDYDNFVPPYQNNLGLSYPENGEKVVTILFPYTRSQSVWFCPADQLAGTDSTEGFIRHRYASYRELGALVWAAEKPVAVDLSNHPGIFDIRTSEQGMLSDNLWHCEEVAGIKTSPPLYSHGGRFVKLFFDGHAKSYTRKKGDCSDE